MKSNVCIIFILIFMSISLSACAAAKAASPAGGASGANQAADASISGDAGGSSSAAGEHFLTDPNTYKAVLQNESAFFSADDHREFFLNDFLKRNSEYEGTYQITQFAVLDLDQDGMPEVILELSLNNYPEQYEVLHDSDGTIYGYNIAYRGFEMLKADGTYQYADGASDVGIQRISSFQPDSAETETLGCAQSDDTGGKMEISYFINQTPATKETFDAFQNRQDEKDNAQWYGFSAENIEAKIRTDWKADSASETTDSRKSYEGSWVVRKVLAYGIGTYSSADAEKLVGKNVSFSEDEADLFTDQPSDVPAIIPQPEYRETTETSDAFQSDYRMSFDKLGIDADSVTEVQVTGSGGAGGAFLIKDSNTLILIAGGTYFELARQ